jgi:alpha-ketoglutarate-dependent taurine dioxygenase
MAVLSALLVEHGGIVFRGFPVESAEDFDRLVKVLGPSELSYAGGAALRGRIKGDVYEATRLAPSAKILLHQEMAYLPEGPGRVVFFCRQPADRGGETFIGDMRRITQALPTELRQRLERLDTVVIRNFATPPPEGAPEPTNLIHPDQRSWRTAFYTSDRHDVEKVCVEKGMTPIWHEDNSLTTKAVLPNFKRHPATGEKVIHTVAFGNADDYNKIAGADAAAAQAFTQYIESQRIRSGSVLSDGSIMPKEERELIMSIYEQHELSWAWKAGDIMLLDNLLVGHGRYAYSGNHREVLVGLLR